MPTVSSPFSITAWEPAAATAWDDPRLGRVVLRKAYTGAIEGTAVAEMLTCVADPDDLARGAVYTAVERFEGRIDGREGTVVFQHGAVSGPTGASAPAGVVVPGSGTGALAGLAGTVTIDPAAHVLTLDASVR